MARNWKIISESASQYLDLVIKSFAIITVATIVILFVSRFIICIYYNLPIIYSSIDIIRALPAALAILFSLLVISLHPSTSPLLGNLFTVIKASRTNDNEEIEKVVEDIELYSGMPSVLRMMNSLLIDKVVKSILNKLPKNNDKVKKDENKKGLVNHRKNKRKYSSEVLIDFAVSIAVALLMVCLFLYGEPSFITTFNLSPGTIAGIKAIAVIIVMLMELYYAISTFRSLRRDVIRFYIDKDKKGEKTKEKRKINRKELSKNMAFYTLFVLCALTIGVMLFGLLLVTEKKQYDIVEIEAGQKTESYAVIIDLDDTFVLQPIGENGNELTIQTNEYMFVSKNNVKVERKSYDEVTVKR